MVISNRTDLAKYFKKLGFKAGAEIGVDTGIYSEILCKANPELKLYSIDMWGINGGASRQIRRKRFNQAKKRLKPYNVILIKKNSLDVVKDFANNSLDFVYIDAGHHFDAIMQDIICWTKKVRKGGIVSGHDYIPPARKAHVITAVDAYVKAHSYHLKVTADPSEPFSWWFNKRWNS